MLHDGQGSTRQLLNSSQTVTASYIRDSFGNSVGGSGSSANPFIWNGGSGYYSDAESGLQKVGARFYDPAVGRWISQDTLLVAGSAADSQSVNRYSYCAANPIGAFDPSGHHGIPGDFWWEAAIVVIGAAICVVCIPEAVAGVALGKGIQFLLVLTYEAIVHLVGYIVKYQWQHRGTEHENDCRNYYWRPPKPGSRIYYHRE